MMSLAEDYPDDDAPPPPGLCECGQAKDAGWPCCRRCAALDGEHLRVDARVLISELRTLGGVASRAAMAGCMGSDRTVFRALAQLERAGRIQKIEADSLSGGRFRAGDHRQPGDANLERLHQLRDDGGEAPGSHGSDYRECMACRRSLPQTAYAGGDRRCHPCREAYREDKRQREKVPRVQAAQRTSRVCLACKVEQPVGNFSPAGNGYRDSRCRPCRRVHRASLITPEHRARVAELNRQSRARIKARKAAEGSL